MADDLVVDGLLTYLGDTDEAARDRRMERLRASLHAGGRRGGSHRVRRWAMATAAVVVLANALFLLGLPGGASAMAEVRQTIEALRAPGDRRYEVRLVLAGAAGGAQDEPGEPNAVIDMRSPGLMVVRHHPPGSAGEVVAGRDAQGEWAIGTDGTVVRNAPRRFFPPWSVNDQSLIVDSVDRVLEQLLDRYDLSNEPSAPVVEGGPRLERVLGKRLDATRGPLPDEVELWLDPATNLPQRIEMRWDRRHASPFGDRGFGDRPPGGPPPGERPAGERAPGGPPESDAPRQAPPGSRIDRIVLDRVDAPALPEGWFTPEHHAAP